MVKKIVYFCTAPLVHFHINFFGEDILIENGFQVSFFDFSPLVFPALKKDRTSPDKFKSKNQFPFYDIDEAIQAIRKLDKECFVIMSGWYQEETFPIWKALSKSNIPYAVLASVTHPFGMGHVGKSFWWKWFSLLYNFKPNKLKTIIYKPLFAPLYGIRPPNICILGGEKSYENNKNVALIGKDTELLWAHAHDYDEYLRNLTENIDQENIVVFIDLGCPKFPWDQLNPRGVTHLTVEKYYPSLCKFFDYLEMELGLKVVIAAHPKSNHEEYPDYFGKRQTFKAQTHKLVKKAKLVISHASTALNLIVLEKKPVLFITTAEYEVDLEYSKRMRLMAAPLGKTCINIDTEPCPIDWGKELVVDMELYSNYERNYIKKENSEQLNTWQIMANRLKSF